MPPAKNNWKSSYVTWGVLLAVLGAAATVVTLTRRGEQEIRSIAAEGMQRHVDKDIDRAHKALPARYVKKRELNGAMYQIKIELKEIRSLQETLLQRINWLHRRNRGRRPR
jgi:hypothetical protein